MTPPPCECHKNWGPTAFVEYVENRLGWAPVDTEAQPRWKSLMLEASKVKRKVAQNPELNSWENLLATVDFLAKKKVAVKTPLGVFFFVDDVVKRMSAAEAVDNMAGAMFVAITEAMVAGESEWVERLARARGPAREVALNEWRLARG